MKTLYLLAFNLFLLLSANCVSAQTARDLFLKADNLTKNGSLHPQYRDYVELTSFQFGAERPISRVGGQFKGDPSSFREIAFTQLTSVNSAPFLSHLMIGSIISEMEFISLRNSNQDRSEVAYKVELKDVMITSGTTSINGGGAPVESFTITYKAIKITTYSQDARGNLTANPPFMYDQDTKTEGFQ